MNVFLGATYLVIDDIDEIYPVSLYFDDIKLKKGRAYIHDDVVYIYRGKIEIDKDVPGIYKNKSGEYVFVQPSKKDIKNIYSVNNLMTLDPNDIIHTIMSNKEQFVQPEDIEIINNNSEIYTPMIKDTDDFLKVLVKKTILEKKINLRAYKSKLKNEYALNNMTSGLKRSTKMTVPNFLIWCEILGVDWEIVVRDNGTDKINPLERDITISSDEF